MTGPLGNHAAPARKCPRCGGPEIPLFREYACANECDVVVDSVRVSAGPQLPPGSALWRLLDRTGGHVNFTGEVARSIAGAKCDCEAARRVEDFLGYRSYASSMSHGKWAMCREFNGQYLRIVKTRTTKRPEDK